MTLWFLLLKFHHPVELLASSVLKLQHPLYAANAKLATDYNKLFCFLGLVGLYPRNWWDDIPWKTTVWEWWRSTGTRQLCFLQGNKQILVVGRWKRRYLEFYQQLICLAVGRAKPWWTLQQIKEFNPLWIFGSNTIIMSCVALNMCSKCKTWWK